VDNITTQIDNLSELSDDQVAGLQTDIMSEFDALEQQDLSSETVDRMTSLAEMLDTVRDEVSKREADATELASRAAEAASRVHGAAIDSEVPADADAAVDDLATASTTTDENSELSTEETSIEATPVVAAAEEVTEEVAAEDAPAEEVEAEEAATDSSDEAPAEPEAEAEATTEEPEAAAEETPEAELSTEAPAEVEAEIPAEAEASTIENTIEPEAQEEASPVTAAVEESFEAPADRRPVVEVTEAPVAITAGAEIPGIKNGSNLENMDGVAKAMTERLRALKGATGGDGEKSIVASMATTFPETLQLGQDPFANQRKIDAANEATQAITASGGHATPYPVRYNIFGFGTDARPVRDSLPSFQADRGGIRYVRPPVLSAYAGAVGVWTNTVDTTPGGATKNSLTVAGATELSAATDAITLQLQVGNFLGRAFPELVARHNELALIQHARISELNILSQIASNSTAVTTTNLIGFARDFLVEVRRAAAAYRSRSRIDPNTQLQAIIPIWVYDAMASDLTLAMPGDDNLGVTKSEIQSYLDLSNVKLTASLDQNAFGAQSTGALLEFPDSFTWYLFSEGSFLFLDGGTLDIGIIRDSTLVGTNDYKMFVETFEGLAFVGIESLAITSTISVNGVAAALRDTTGGATAAVIEM
jgi:hypothetical protein